MEKYRLVDIIRAIIQGKKFVIIFTTIVAISAIVYSLVTPKYWKSSTSFAINSSASGLNIDLPGNLGSMLGSSGLSGLLGGSSDYVDFLNIINSRQFSENLIKQFDLLTYFEINEADSLKAMDLALQELDNVVSSGYNDKTQLLAISVESKDKQLSYDMALFIRQEAVRIKKEKDSVEDEREFEFFKSRLSEYNLRLENLLMSLKEFQEQNNILEMEEQAKGLISNYAQIISKATEINIQKDIAESQYGKDFPQVQILNKQKNLLKQEVEKLEKNDLSANKYIVGLDILPEIANKYANLLVEKEIIEKTLVSFYPLYEASRFSYIQDNDLITVLDEPRLAGQRTKPKRAMIVVVTTFFAFLFSAYVAFFWNSKSTTEKGEWLDLWRLFWGKK